jgi:hypothetical protein
MDPAEVGDLQEAGKQNQHDNQPHDELHNRLPAPVAEASGREWSGGVME